MSSIAPVGSPTHADISGDLSRRGISLENKLAALLFLLAAGLYLWPIAGASRDYDEGVYWQSLRAMAEGHPLFTSIFSSQPPMFLLSVYPFYMAFGQSIAAARIGIALFAVAGIVAMYWLAGQLGGRWAGLIAAALLMLDPHYMRQAQTLQAEGPAVAIEILAVALAVAASRRAGHWRMALATLTGAAVALGVLIKLLDVVALVPISLYLSAPLLRAFDGGSGRLRRPSAAQLRVNARAAARDLGLVVAGGVITTVIVLAPFAGSLGAVWDQAVAFHLAAMRTEPWHLGTNLRTVLAGFQWIGVPAALAIGVAWWRRDWRMAPPLLWLLASALVLVRQVPLFDHHVVIIAPCLALMVALTPTMLGPDIVRRGIFGPDMRQVTSSWLGLAVGVFAAVIFMNSLVHGLTATQVAARSPSSATQAEIAAIESSTSPGEVIVSDDQYTAAAAGRSVPPQLVDTSFVRASSGYLTAAQLKAILIQEHIRVVIVDSGRLDKVPGFIPWLHEHYQKKADASSDARVFVELTPSHKVA